MLFANEDKFVYPSNENNKHLATITTTNNMENKEVLRWAMDDLYSAYNHKDGDLFAESVIMLGRTKKSTDMRRFS